MSQQCDEIFYYFQKFVKNYLFFRDEASSRVLRHIPTTHISLPVKKEMFSID